MTCFRRLPRGNPLSITVAIIGAGPLGRWLALAAASKGCRVLLEDVMPVNLRHAQEELRRQLSAEAVPAVAFVQTIEDAVRAADLVIDCVPDELESKLEILWLLDRMAPPHTILVTPTTHLSIADLAACTYRADRCVAIAASAFELTSESAMKPEGAALLLRKTERTSDSTIQLIASFWQQLGFAPAWESEPA